MSVNRIKKKLSFFKNFNQHVVEVLNRVWFVPLSMLNMLTTSFIFHYVSISQFILTLCCRQQNKRFCEKKNLIKIKRKSTKQQHEKKRKILKTATTTIWLEIEWRNRNSKQSPNKGKKFHLKYMQLIFFFTVLIQKIFFFFSGYCLNIFHKLTSEQHPSVRHDRQKAFKCFDCRERMKKKKIFLIFFCWLKTIVNNNRYVVKRGIM